MGFLLAVLLVIVAAGIFVALGHKAKVPAVVTAPVDVAPVASVPQDTVHAVPGEPTPALP